MWNVSNFETYALLHGGLSRVNIVGFGLFPARYVTFFVCKSTVNESNKIMDGKEPTAQPPSECVWVHHRFLCHFLRSNLNYLKLNYYPCGPSEQQQIQKWKIEKSASCNVKPKEKWTTRNFGNRNGTVGAFVTFSFNNNWNWFELWPQ